MSDVELLNDWSEHWLNVKKHLKEVQDLMNSKKYAEAKKKATDLSVDGHLLRLSITIEEEKWTAKDPQ
jgi:hypothetical protein